jgi:hypothetical protein
MNYWLKMIGSGGDPCRELYALQYNRVHFRKGDNVDSIHIHQGDRMVLYACGGSQCVFALATVTSEVKVSNPEHPGWPYQVDISYLVQLPVSAGVHIDEVSTPGGRDLSRSLRQSCYISLSQQEYARAEARLLAAQAALQAVLS